MGDRLADRPDYAEYVAQRSPRLLRFAFLLCRDWALAEDLLQASLERTWRAWRRVGGDPDPYVYRVMVNTHASWWRRKWRGEIPTERPPEAVAAGDAFETSDSRGLLWAALGRLPHRQRTVLVLRFFEDLSEAETATIMGVSVGTVKSQSSKALAKLRIDPEIALITERGTP